MYHELNFNVTEYCKLAPHDLSIRDFLLNNVLCPYYTTVQVLLPILSTIPVTILPKRLPCLKVIYVVPTEERDPRLNLFSLG